MLSSLSMIGVTFTGSHFTLGTRPKISGYEAALQLYEREAGPHPEKVCHVCFIEKKNMVSRKMVKN